MDLKDFGLDVRKWSAARRAPASTMALQERSQIKDSTSPWAVKKNVQYRSYSPMTSAINAKKGWNVQTKKAMVEELPWYMQGKSGGFLGKRREEIEEIDPQKIYGLSAPSVRKTTEGLMSGIEEDAARRNLSPAMVALARKGLLQGELEGLGSAAGQSAVGAYGMREQARTGLAGMEASLGAQEMASRRGVAQSKRVSPTQSALWRRQDRKQQESQGRLSRFWENYGR